MKKFMTLAAIFAAVMMSFTACEDTTTPTPDNGDQTEKPAPDQGENNGEENNGEENNGEETPVPARKVLKALPSKIDDNGNMTSGRTFRYNQDGSLAGVDEVWTNKETGELESWNLDIVRTGNKLQLIDNAASEGPKVEYEWEVNEKGYVVKNGDYSYEYDADDHLVKVIEDWGEGPQVVSICTWENGNMTSWTKEQELENEETGEKYARVKRQTYSEELNVGGIFTVFTEKSSLKKWMFEAGFFGKPSKNLVATDKWDDNEKGAEFEFRTDDDDYVVAEFKYYGGELDATTYYIWE